VTHPTNSQPPPSPVQVLVVDDDFEFRSVLADTLTDLRWTVRSAASGIDALHLLRSWHLDLILFDLLMPIMDGWSFHAEADRRKELKGIPLVLISGAPTALHDAAAIGCRSGFCEAVRPRRTGKSASGLKWSQMNDAMSLCASIVSIARLSWESGKPRSKAVHDDNGTTAESTGNASRWACGQRPGRIYQRLAIDAGTRQIIRGVAISFVNDVPALARLNLEPVRVPIAT
jgi:CheY-like chemotaxis protein